jgi:glycosyltransferase involved in cell wall biosynthesis
MKIVHVIESGGGSADFVLYLIKYLPQHHHTVIYGDRTFGNRLDDIKQSFAKTEFYKWKNVQREIKLGQDVKATRSLYRLLKKIEADVIHLHSSKAGFIGRFVAFFLRKENVIYTPNGLPFMRTDISPLKMQTYLTLEKIAHRLTGKIVCCSKSEAEEFMKRGVDCVYINNGTEIFESRDREKNSDGILVATTGRVTIQKNPALFNEIAKHFENDPAVKFLWIGGGELEQLLTAKNIEITGWVDKNTVLERLISSDVYMSTASWEGLPFAVLEAMNLYKPLILSNCVGNIDLVEKDCNGFIFENVDEAVNKLIVLSQNKKLIQQYGNNSHQLALEKFNVEKMALLYERMYYSKISQ